MSTNVTELRPAPVFMLGAGLLVWGWQNNFLLYAALMAILLETAHWVSWRWYISDKEFNNITDLSGTAFFITVVYIFTTEGAKGIFIILSILPFICFLIVLTQIYSQRGKIKLSALSSNLRRLESINAPGTNISYIDVSLPYFLICLISASAGNQRTIWFSIFCSALIAWLLWTVRPKRYWTAIWLSMLMAALLLSYSGQQGMQYLQTSLEASFMRFFDQFMWRYRDPDRATTAIGSISRLKFSDRVIVRIKTDKFLTEPLYLREATYNSYNYGVWTTLDPLFTAYDPDGSDSWTLNNSIQSDRQAEISSYMIKEEGVIPVPHGTNRITGNGIIGISENSYGTIKMDIREGWVRYNVDYQTQRISDNQPDVKDLFVADTYTEDFDRLAEELQLHGKPPEQIIRIVEDYFTDNYFYSLTRRSRYPKGKHLHNFLFETKRGHCEYFATATVLLLRSAGIPARYAVGYSTQEYSRLERQYIARVRHAHSWVLAYIGDDWEIIDTTPSVWAALEEENTSGLKPLIDLWSWASYRIFRWQTEDELEQDETSYDLLWILIPLILILAWRLYFAERVNISKFNKQKEIYKSYPGMDSSFYEIVSLLEKHGFKRHAGETLRAWLTRIEKKIVMPNLDQALALHYCYRYDPNGLSIKAKQKFETLIANIMLNIKKSYQ